MTEKLREQFDCVIVDTAPLSLDSTVTAAVMDTISTDTKKTADTKKHKSQKRRFIKQLKGFD